MKSEPIIPGRLYLVSYKKKSVAVIAKTSGEALCKILANYGDFPSNDAN